MAAKDSTKRSASRKRAGPAKESPRAEGDATASSDKRKRHATGGGRKDPPPSPMWITGLLAVNGDGEIGIQPATGDFITLQQAAAEGHMVNIVFQPTTGVKSIDVAILLAKLAEFIQVYGVENIPCGLTCCGAP